MFARRAASYAVIAAALIAPWEGLATTAEPDKLAHGLPTVCYGMTPYDRPVKVGDTYTPEQCMNFLVQDIPRYKKPLEKCVHVPLTNHQWAALVSGAYNAGSGAMCQSPMVRRFNEGEGAAACISFLGWHEYAGGEWRRGLHNRRMAERKVCETKD